MKKSPKDFNSFMTAVPIIKNQSIGLQSKSKNWFLYDRDLRHERVKAFAASVWMIDATGLNCSYLQKYEKCNNDNCGRNGWQTF